MIMQYKCYKVYKGYTEFDTTKKTQKDKKLASQIKSVENTDLYKLALNKTVTTQE